MLEKGLASLSGWTTRFYARAQVTKEIGWRKVKAKLMNERGGVSLEWIALGMVTFGILAAIGVFFKNNSGDDELFGNLGKAIVGTLEKVLNGVEIQKGD